VLEPEARRAQRLNPRILQRLEDLSAQPPAAILAAEVERAGAAGTTLQSLAQLTALSKPRLVELIRTLPLMLTRSGTVLRKADVDGLLARVPALLAQHAALALDELLEMLGTGAEVLDEALRALLARGVIGKRGSQFLIPQAERARARDEANLAAQIADVLRRGGLSPPSPSAIVTDLRSNRAVERLLREGVIVRAIDVPKGREILFHQEAIEDAQRRLAPLLERAPGLLVTEIGALLGISRKFTMPLLNHLDTIRFTRRVKDRRVRA
jgi:selenocysteine-specific elongation factor